MIDMAAASPPTPWKQIRLPLVLASGLVCWPLLTPCAMHSGQENLRWNRSYGDRITDPEVRRWAQRPPRLPDMVVDRALRSSRLLSEGELGLQVTRLDRQEYGGVEIARDMATALASMYSLTLLDPEVLGFEKGKEEKFLPVRERPRVEVNADTIALRRQADDRRSVALARCTGGARAVVTGEAGTLHLSARRIDYRAEPGELLLYGYPKVLAGLRYASLPGDQALMRLDLRQFKITATGQPEIGGKSH
jgi:hypothetical protein